MLTDLSPELEPEAPTVERPGHKEPLVVKEHEDIVLTTTLATPSVAAVRWFKDGVEIRRSKRHETASLEDTHTLRIRGAQTLDTAVYSCRVGADGQDFPVQVEGQQGRGCPLGTPCVLGHQVGGGGSLVMSRRQRPSVEPEWDSAQDWSTQSLSPGWSPTANTPFHSTEVAAKFYRPLEPIRGELGHTVTLICELSPPQAEVVWHCGSTQLRASKRFQMEAAGPRRSLTVSDLRLEDAGEYACETRDDRTSAQLTVSGRQWCRAPGGLSRGGAHSPRLHGGGALPLLLTS